MSTKSSVFYGPLGHLYYEMMDGCYYWEVKLFGIWRYPRIWLPFAFFWRRLDHIRYWWLERRTK